MPLKKLNLLKLPAANAAQPGQSWGDSSEMPAVAAWFFTTCQITFSEVLSPQTEPFLVTQRNSRRPVIGGDIAQTSTADFTQSGTGTVGMWAALPTKSVVPLLKVVDPEVGHLAPAQTASEH